MKEDQVLTEKSIAWTERTRSGAMAIREQLEAVGLIGTDTSLLVGNPGSGEEWLYLEMTNEVQLGLAEPAVGSIADGAGRVKSVPAVAIAHGFVGFSGLQGDVFNAAQRQSPMLVIVGCSDTQAHTGVTHMYADIEGAAKAALCKYVKNATDPKTLIRDLRDCIVEAMSPPFGPVVMIVGSNISMSENNESILKPQLPNPHFAPPYEVFIELAEKMVSAQTPGILIGDGIARSQAFDELMEVATLLGAQVWGSMESEINFPRNHGLYKGNLGHMDDSVGRELLDDLDFALAVGTPVYQTVFNSKEPLFKANVGVAAINPDIASTLKGHTDVGLPIKGDPKTSLALLAKAIKEKQNEKQAFYAKERFSEMEEAKKATIAKDKKALLEKPGVTMAKFAEALEEKLSSLENRPIIFNEALNGAVGLTNFIKNIDLPGKYYDTCGGSLGEWAGGVGAAYVGGPTLSFIGDGGFNYAPQVLWNAAHKNLPIGFVVAHNTEYGLLYDNMNFMLKKMHIDPGTIPHPHFYDLPQIDFVKIAEGYGVAGMRVDHEHLVQEAVNQLVDFSKPFLVDLILAK